MLTVKFIYNLYERTSANQRIIDSQPEPKRNDMQALPKFVLKVLPGCKLWFLDGKNSENKTVSNPNMDTDLTQ